MMKKTLLGMAVLAGFCGSVHAQTNVTVYGIVDAGLVRESGGPAGSVTGLNSGVSAGSRLGFRGVEDLGGGMSAQFVLESGFLIDTGALGQGGLIFGRQAFVGLGNAYGSLTLGRQYTPLYGSVLMIDPFQGCCMAPTSANLLSEGGIRMNNTVKFTSHQISGFSGEIAYGLGEVAGDNSAGRQIGGSLIYASGPFTARLTHHNANNVPTATAAADNGKTTLLGGTYDFGVAKVALAYAVNKGLVPISGTINRDSRDALAGVTIPFGASTILASYIHKQDKSGLGQDASQWGIAYTYNLSKRTLLYTAYARINNNAAPGRPGFYTVGNASSVGSGDKAFNLGIRHTF